MGYLTILLFLVYCYGLGFSIASFVRKPDNFLERNLIRLGIGLSALPLLGVLLSVLHVPVDWKIILLISAIYPAFYILKNYKSLKFNFKFGLKKSDVAILAVIIIFFASFYMYYKGSTAYPYLEDDDPWSHAIGVKYVSIEKTFFDYNGAIGYLDPYPPAYNGLLGILNQTSPSLMWTLKFFNALIISFSLVFFYLFIKAFTNNRNMALISTILLAMVPAYLSHFIWAHSLIPGFIFLSFFCLEMIKHDKKWVYIASIAISSVILTSTTQSIKFILLFLIYFAIKSIIEKKFVKEIFLSGALGFMVTLLWWIPLTIKYKGIVGLLGALGFPSEQLGFSFDFFNTLYFYSILFGLIIVILGYYLIKNKLTDKQRNLVGILFAVAMLLSYIAAYSLLIDVQGTGDRIYDFNDFFIAEKTNMINNPIGIGVALFSLFIASLFWILYEHYFFISKKRDQMPRFQFTALLSLILVSSLSLFVSLISFSQFKFEPGTIIKHYGLENPDNLSYFLSFSFNAWGIYLFIGSLLLSAIIATFLIFKGFIPKEKVWLPISLLWLTYTFSSLYDLPTTLFTFRFWMLFAFVVSIIAGYGLTSLLNLNKNISILKLAIGFILIISVFFTSGIQKYSVNTAQWPPGAFWTSSDEISGYIWLKENLPTNAKVFTFSNNAPIIGMDKFICHWCTEVRDFQRNGFNQSAEQNYQWLKREQYKYAVIDGQTARIFGINKTNSKVNGYIGSSKFKPVYTNNALVIFEVV